MGSVRTLGQDKKPSESEDGEAQNPVSAAEGANNQDIAAGQALNQQQSAQFHQQQQQQQYQQMAYYQHPGTGQVPYYGAATGAYPDYMYGYSQDPYNQQAAWQTWQQQQQQQQQASGVNAGNTQQQWGSTGHAQNQQQQYGVYPSNTEEGGMVPALDTLPTSNVQGKHAIMGTKGQLSQECPQYIFLVLD